MVVAVALLRHLQRRIGEGAKTLSWCYIAGPKSSVSINDFSALRHGKLILLMDS